MNADQKCLLEILDDSEESIFVTDLERTILYANKKVLSISQSEPGASLEGKKCYQALLNRSTPCPFCKMELFSRDSFTVRNFLLPQSGKNHTYEMRGRLIDWGGIPAHAEYIRDITAQVFAETETKLGTILESMHGGIAVYQVKGTSIRTVMFNDGILKMQGYTRQEYESLASANAINAIYEEDRENMLRMFHTAIKDEAPLTATYRVYCKDGGFIWIDMTATPVGRDSEGCLRYNAVFSNVSHQFDLYQQVFNTLGSGLVVTDQLSDEIYFSNSTAQTILKAMRDSGQDLTFFSFSDAPLAPRILDADGRKYRVTSQPVKWMGRRAIARYFQDVTDEMRLQNRLKVNEERFRLVVEKGSIAIIDQDLLTNSLYTNTACQQYAFSDTVCPDDIFASWTDPALVCHEDLPLLDKFFDTIRSGSDYALATLRLKMRDGTYRWTEANALVIRGSQKEIIRKIAFFQDVDEVSRQYADLKKRYDYELARQKSSENNIIERMTLDLTAGTVAAMFNPSAPAASRFVGISIDELLAARVSHAVDEAEKQQLTDFLSPSKLLQAYFSGGQHTLERKGRLPGSAERRYFLSTANFAKDPDTGHIMAFVDTIDSDLSRTTSLLLWRLLETSYETAAVISTATGKIKLGILAGQSGFTTDIDASYDELAREAILQSVIPEEQESTARAMSLSGLCESLEKAPSCTGRCTLVADGRRVHKMWTAVYFDDSREHILLTQTDITDVYEKDLKTAHELREALANAEVASRAKSTFLAHMSHEIRTPISTIAGVLELILHDCDEGFIHTDRLRRQVNTADTANRYLLTLINDILDISKIESNELVLTTAVTDIRQPIRALRAMIQTLAEQKGIHLVLQRRTNIGNWYRIDSVRVQQILMNLLSNAIKFTPQGGTVCFSGEMLRREGNMATIQFIVRDTGIGIGDEFKNEIFEPFKQEHSGTSSSYGGTGLGLAISRSLAQLMGGDITFESEKGKGSAFTVTMQMEIVPPPEQTSSSVSGQEELSLEGIHVLLCEDNQINQMIIQELLELKGCTVTTASDGNEGVSHFRQSPVNGFDLILMDIRMPHMDGLEAAKTIRSLPRPDAPQIPIIAMSANAYEEDRQLSLSAGMNEHLSKPVDANLLYQAILKHKK